MVSWSVSNVYVDVIAKCSCWLINLHRTWWFGKIKSLNISGLYQKFGHGCGVVNLAYLFVSNADSDVRHPVSLAFH